MRRTYKSKKDAPGAIDHRDVLHNIDGKSSLFDAYYIQNIKNTKREMSVGSCMQFSASNKVRKRKYLKRVKEQSPILTESLTKSAYLTPDKSIRVNRGAPDLFDQLLISSPAETQKEDKLRQPEIRTYRKKKNKRINYSTSSSSDSDKENSYNDNTRNSSNIKSYQLVIENINRTKQIDQSINNLILNDLSVFNDKFNHSPIKVETSPIISRIKNNNLLLENSPLCSTPFRDKYRGKSIYKFSPIAINSKKYNVSIVSPASKTSNINDNISSDVICSQINVTPHGRKTNEQTKEDCFESDREEPLLGFICKFNEKTEINNKAVDNMAEELHLVSIPTQIDHHKRSEESNEISKIESIHSTDVSDGCESIYDTCSEESEQNIELNNCERNKEPIVILNKLNNSIFDKYYKVMADFSSNGGEYHNENDSNNENTEMNKSSLNELDPECLKDCCEKDYIEQSISHDIHLDETCGSFVTTRRRNKVGIDSFILSLNDSLHYDSDISSGNNSKKSDLCEEEAVTKYDLDISHMDKNSSNEEVTIRENTLNLHSKHEKIENLNLSNIEIRSSRKCESSDVANVIDLSLSNTQYPIMTRNKAGITKNQNHIKEETHIFNNINRHMSKTDTMLSCNQEIEDTKHGIILKPGKKWERSLSIYRRMTTMADHFDESALEDENLQRKGRKYRQSVMSNMELQEFKGPQNDTINSRRSTFLSKSIRPSITVLKENDISRLSICSTTVCEDLQGYLTDDCDDTVIELSKLSIADCDAEVTVLENDHDTSHCAVTARDYVLRRCDQTDALLFDECYPNTVLKNCRKIGEGVYGEVFLWRARDGQARVLKIIPVAGTNKVNGENQKDFSEIISEIVIAMELSALRTPIAEIEQHLNEGRNIEEADLHSIENASDVFNEVVAVRCVYGSYPSRLLDLWDLYDECKGSENDNPATLPVDQQFIVLELANAGQDLESYQFNNAEQAYSVFRQVAYGLAVAEEAFQFEHRDLHWGNVLIAPTEEKLATFVVRGRAVRVARRGVAATVIDYSLSRLALRPARGSPVALFHDLASDEALFEASGDYQFELYRLMRHALGNDWKNYEPYTNVLWLHYTADKMITSLRYTRPGTKIHKQYITKLRVLKEQLLTYRSAADLVLTPGVL